MQVADINGIDLHYRLDGPEDAPVIVFSNSLGTDLRIWDRVVAALGGAFRTLRYDKRGHGLSGVTPAPYRIEDHRDDLIALLDHLELDDVILCGLSVGGLIVQATAAAQPERIKGLILCDTGYRIGTTALWQERIALVGKVGLAGIADNVIERWLSPAFRRDSGEAGAWKSLLLATPDEGYLGTCAALRDADLAASTAELRLPALCLCGGADLATAPELVRATAALIPGADYHEFPGVGHLPCIEVPGPLAQRIADFVEEKNLAG